MNKLRYRLFCILFILLIPCGFIYGQSEASIAEAAALHRDLETMIQSGQSSGKDTTTLKKQLAPIFKKAKQERNIPMLWAYYLALADGCSIAYDYTNASSDRYFDLAEGLLAKHPNATLEMMGLIRRGYYNFVYRKVNEAFPYFLQANDLKDKVNLAKMPLAVKHYQFMASFFNHIGNEDRAVQYLKAVLPYSKPNTRERIDLLNSISHFLSIHKPNQEALSYLNQAMEEAKATKDSTWIGILSGNLAVYSWDKGRKQESIDLLKMNIALSMRYNEPLDAMRANLQLARAYISLKEWQPAKQAVEASKKIMEKKPYFLQYEVDAAHALAEIAAGLDQKDVELNQLKQYLVLKDSLEKRTDVKEMQRIIWDNEMDKYNRTVELSEQKRTQTMRMYQFAGIFVTLIFAIILLLINKSKARIKIKNTLLEKDQLKLSYDKQLLDQEVVILKNSLDEFVNTIMLNDLIITQLRQELSNAAASSNSTQVNIISESLNSLLESHIMTEDRWLNFQKVFDKVYPEYLHDVKKSNDKITDNDLKILALQKLNLNNGAMSELLCVSVEAIKKAKQRLKKKMN